MKELSDGSLDGAFGLFLVEKILKIMAILNGFWMGDVLLNISAQLIESFICLLARGWRS
jgi:hypothetical protein